MSLDFYIYYERSRGENNETGKLGAWHARKAFSKKGHYFPLKHSGWTSFLMYWVIGPTDMHISHVFSLPPFYKIKHTMKHLSLQISDLFSSSILTETHF